MIIQTVTSSWSAASYHRYPQRVYTKRTVFKVYNLSKGKTALCPPIPLPKNSTFTWIDSRHYPVIVRKIACCTCGELNESGQLFCNYFLYCYCCGACQCAICVVLFFPNQYPTTQSVQSISTEERTSSWICLDCRNLNESKSLSVCVYFHLFLYICI